MKCMAWVGPVSLAVLLGGCSPKAPDQALQISGSLDGKKGVGFVLPKTGQVLLTLGSSSCDGVLSDFKDDPRTGLLTCHQADGQPTTYRLTATMKSTDRGVLSLTSVSDKQPEELELLSSLGIGF